MRGREGVPMEELNKLNVTINDLEQLHDFFIGKITFEDLVGEADNNKYAPRNIVCDLYYQYTLDMLRNAMELYKDKDPNMFFDFYLRIICRCLLGNLNLGKKKERYGPDISEYPKWDLFYYIADFKFDIPRTEDQLLLYVTSMMIEKYLQTSFEVPLGRCEDVYYGLDYYGVDENFFSLDEYDETEDVCDRYTEELISINELTGIIDKGYEVIDTFRNNYTKPHSEWVLSKSQAVNFINNNVSISIDFLKNLNNEDRSLLVKCLDTITNTKKEDIECAYWDAYYLKAFLLWDSIPGYYQKDLDCSKELLETIYTCKDVMERNEHILVTFALGILHFVDFDYGLSYLKSLNYFYTGHYAELQIEEKSQMACYLPAFIGYKNYRYQWSQKAIDEEEKLYSSYKEDYISGDMSSPFADAALNMYFLKEDERGCFTYAVEAISALKRRQKRDDLYRYIIDQYLIDFANDILRLYKEELDEYSFDGYGDTELLEVTEKLRSGSMNK